MLRWVLGALAAALLAAALHGGSQWLRRAEAPIVVGLLHSQSGPLAVVEEPMLDAAVLALEEINAQGGLLGRQVKWVIGDGRSDPQTFRSEARRLVDADKVCALFGGLTSACRREMEDAAKSREILVFNAGQYEGCEYARDMVGFGPLPNNQAVPAVSWCMDSLKARKFFLAGIEDVSSYAIHAVVRDQLKALGGSVVGEEFVKVDGKGVTELVAAMKSAGADVVVSSIVGDANRALFQQATAAGLTAEKLPMVCLRVSEDDLQRLPHDQTAGRYAVWSYFHSAGDEASRRLVDKFKARFGSDRTTSDPSVSMYFAVKMWAQAVAEGESIESTEVRDHLSRQSLETGAGVVAMDIDMIHVWRPIRVGKITLAGRIEQVWAMEQPIRPTPFPVFRTRSIWEAALRRWRVDGKSGLPESSTTAPSPSAKAAAPPPPPVVWGPRGTVRAAAGPRETPR
ncbi:transporter substrate-binding protein [Paludisphaera rhizosphaerae]|uniref:transporter substrate-binding protein n=1 Tax=Paludisphaera rhizosphaerae TaxID=2711216 RepID=UPI0013E9A960|nr:transporter substrate-binding protein [Paludisphaera rhizosphaerae]